MPVSPIRLKPSRLAPLLRPISAFLAAESAGGMLLLFSAAAALVWANSRWAHAYHEFWHAKGSIQIAGLSLTMSLQHWVNDGLMVIFFLLVGLEIKRELLIGELASLRRASLPVAAAIGGMVIPAAIYAMLNARGAGAAGWGIPMATDIAFAAGVLTLVGRALPTSIKVLLLAVAIVDDLGAVLVVAIFYTSQVSGAALAVAGVFLLGLIVLNLLGVHSTFPYVLLGVGLWAATLYSGVHATVAGVLLAFTIPATRLIEEPPYVKYMRDLLEEFERDISLEPDQITQNQSHALKGMEEASQAVQTPLARIEHALLKPVNFIIVPLFALANAGVDFGGGGLGFASPIMWGVLLGLVIGKPVGILLASSLAVKAGVAALPEGTTWRQVAGIAVLCGIGFTMSLFVAQLAFPTEPALLDAAKRGILAGSLVAGLAGAFIIALVARSARSEPEQP